MTTRPRQTAPGGASTLVRIPARRALPLLVRDPLRTLARIGEESGGALTRLHLGFTRPYLVTHPDHVQHVTRHIDTYRRDGMMWRPLRRLEGHGIAADGPPWQASRRVLQPLFTARHVATITGAVATAVADGLHQLAARRDTAGPAGAAEPVDLAAEMTALVNRVLVRVVFGDRLDLADAARLAPAISTAFSSLTWRLLLPFVSESVPLPGDRTFYRAVRTVDEVMYPLLRRCREAGNGDGDDLVAVLASARDEHGVPLSDQRVRDDVVAMFVAGTETTALALTWLWLLLHRHPDIAEQVAAEAAAVVGDGPVGEHHLPELTYTRSVLQETLRLYPTGWLVPRTVAHPDVLAGHELRPGSTVLLSPYVTHRLPAFWPEPSAFRPERFAPEHARGRHKFAYVPFSMGAHQCLGSQFAMVESQLIVAGLLARYRPRILGTPAMTARATIALEPRQRVWAVLERR